MVASDQSSAPDENREDLQIGMDARDSNGRSAPQGNSLTRTELASFSPRDARTIGLLLCLSAVLFAVTYSRQERRHGGWVAVEDASAAFGVHRLDLNECEWPELCVLPGISETLARRIVHERQRLGAFTTVDELCRIKGIGPKSVERLRSQVYIDPALTDAP